MPPGSKQQQDEDEALWVERLRQSDPEAQAWYDSAHREPLYRAAVYFLGWRDPEAEDVVQETLLQGLAKLGAFEGRSRLSTWLNQICVHLCYKRLRQRQRLALGAEADLRDALELPARGQDALHELLGVEQRQALSKALQGLDPVCRGIIECRDLEGRSYADAAAQLRLPLGTFMSKLSRCRQRLKRLIRARMET